jgi:hypothetical protein
VHSVDIPDWPFSFPPSSVTVTRKPDGQHRLRPDYLAVRSTAADQRGGEWALVESKGTHRCLTSVHACPTSWAEQARNAVVTVDGTVITSPRYLVVATRSNPNAARLTSRRLQVRAWNRVDDSAQIGMPPEAAADIAAAHLFGLFRALRLRETAIALATSVRLRSELRRGHVEPLRRQEAAGQSRQADVELSEHSDSG